MPAPPQALLRSLRDAIARLEKAPPPGGGAVLPTGLAALDALLGGGVVRGRVAELHGGPASGKTTLALLALARATDLGLAAYVDGPGELYAPAVAALGVTLPRLLVVRPKTLAQALWSAEVLARAGTFAVVAADLTGLNGAVPPAASRRLAEAADAGRAAVLLLAPVPTGLTTSLRLRSSAAGPGRLRVEVERGGAPGSNVLLDLADPTAHALPPLALVPG